MKIIKSLKISRILIKDVTQTIENEKKEQSGGFLGVLLGTLGDKEDKETIAISQGRGVVRAGERPIRAEQDFQGHLVF